MKEENKTREVDQQTANSGNITDQITYKFDSDSGLVEFFCGEEEVCTWCCEDSDCLDMSIQDFVKIYNLGYSDGLVNRTATSEVDDHYTKPYHFEGMDMVIKHKPVQPADIINFNRIFDNSMNEWLSFGSQTIATINKAKAVDFTNEAFIADLKQAINQVFHNHKMWPLEEDK